MLTRIFPCIRNGTSLMDGIEEIGAFCEWRNIDVIVSDDRDFLRSLAPDHSFEVLSPAAFCQKLGLYSLAKPYIVTYITITISSIFTGEKVAKYWLLVSHFDHRRPFKP